MSRLSAFRADAGPAPKSRHASWAAPILDDLADGSVVAFDQSLAAFGWVWAQKTSEGVLVRAKGSIKTKPEDYPRGHEGTLQRGLEILVALRSTWAELLREGQDPALLNEVLFVHEMPPVGGAMSRPESSLLSALAVRVFVQEDLGRPITMVANQHSKSVLVNKANATKPEWHAALGTLPITGAKPTNEGERDALCLALTHLIDLKKKAS